MNVAIFKLLKKGFRSEGNQRETKVALLKIIRGPLREFGTLLEVSHDHLLVTPPSHFTPQKVEGLVVGLVGYRQKTMKPIIAAMENLSRFI